MNILQGGREYKAYSDQIGLGPEPLDAALSKVRRLAAIGGVGSDVAGGVDVTAAYLMLAHDNLAMSPVTLPAYLGAGRIGAVAAHIDARALR